MLSTTRLSIARKRRQITKKELAQKVGVTAVNLTRLENGKTGEPNPDTFYALTSHGHNFGVASACASRTVGLIILAKYERGAKPLRMLQKAARCGHI